MFSQNSLADLVVNPAAAQRCDLFQVRYVAVTAVVPDYPLQAVAGFRSAGQV